MSDGKQQVARVAMRVEGDWWVAYLAAPGTMEGALEMGRIRMSTVQDPDRKEAFMGIFSSWIADISEEEFGQRPDTLVQPAPEHERAGRA